MVFEHDDQSPMNSYLEKAMLCYVMLGNGSPWAPRALCRPQDGGRPFWTRRKPSYGIRHTTEAERLTTLSAGSPMQTQGSLIM